jgi:hypothetical protein
MPRRTVAGVAAVLAAGAAFGLAFAVGRATAPSPAPADAIRLVHDLPVGVLDTPAGALAAADNYVAVGITASLDGRELEAFADALVTPAGVSRRGCRGRRRARMRSRPSWPTRCSVTRAHARA